MRRDSKNLLRACFKNGGTGYQPVSGGNLPPYFRRAGSPPQRASCPFHPFLKQAFSDETGGFVRGITRLLVYRSFPLTVLAETFPEPRAEPVRATRSQRDRLHPDWKGGTKSFRECHTNGGHANQG
jgi:hypothetical protein